MKVAHGVHRPILIIIRGLPGSGKQPDSHQEQSENMALAKTHKPAGARQN